MFCGVGCVDGGGSDGEGRNEEGGGAAVLAFACAVAFFL